MNKTQQDQVLTIVRRSGKVGIRTEQVKLAALGIGISCGDRYLRWLAEGKKPKIIRERKEGNKTKTWYYKG